MEKQYQDYLREEFEFRQVRNARYSLRAFSRDLGIPAPKLSQVLKGRGGISPNLATRIAPKLQLGKEEASLFVEMVAAKHSRSRLARAQAAERVDKLKTNAAYGSLALDTFKVISDWYHFAILELTDTQDFRSNAKHVAERLGLSLAAAESAVARLLDLGLLALKKKRWVQTHALLATPSGIPSQAIRQYHRQILAKAEEALDLYPVEMRDFSALTLTVAESQVAEAREEIKKFRRALSEKLARDSAPKERVYSLAVQFFPLEIPRRTP